MADSSQYKFSCSICDKKFKQKQHAQRHERTIHGDVSHKCEICNASFNQLSSLKRHINTHKKRPLENVSYNVNPKRPCISQEKSEHLSEHISKCNWCCQDKNLIKDKPYCVECSNKGRECKHCIRPLPEKYYNRNVDICDTCSTKRENYIKRIQTGGSKSSLKGTVETQEILPNDQNGCDPLHFFKENKKIISDYLEEKIECKTGIKWKLTLQVKFTKLGESGQIITSDPYFSTEVFASTSPNVDDEIDSSFQQLVNRIEMFEKEGSGWTIDQIMNLEIKTITYSPISGSSYITLPKKLQNKKAILNIQNNDECCFKWSVLAHLHPVHWKDNANRVSHYTQYEADLDWSMVSFPTSLSDIAKFEKKNNISINVFGWDNDEIFPLQITESRHHTHINLLLINDGTKRHFCLIRNMSRLLGDLTKHNGQIYYCDYCLHGFSRRDILDSHIPYCSRNAPQKLSLPTDSEKWLEFKNYSKGLKVPFTIYADFECFLQPCSENTKQSEKYQKHIPSGFSYMVVSSVNKYSKQAVVYRGENVMDEFFKCLEQEKIYINNILSEIVPMQLTAEEEETFHSTKKCHICERVLGADRVRDHDHLTGQYRGAAHNSCNLNYKFSKEKDQKQSTFHIPVIVHNLRGYDSHLMMESLGKQTNSRLSCIPNNMENYISFSRGSFRFLDSCQFMNSSLDKLVKNLANDSLGKFKILKEHYSDPEKLELVTRKGVYPYDYITDSSKFLEEKLPTQKDFYNTLNKEELSTADYTHAQKIWQTFNIKNLGEYHDLYLKTDVILLADVFENFRDLCIQCYKLDPAHYYTAPGLAWEAMLRMTGVKLELLTDINMYLMIEQGIRGGTSMISNRYAAANNKYMDGYDSSKPSKYITYLDANNLYGWAMSQPLPYGEFHWLTDEQISQFCVNDISDDSEIGYILDVDLEYPTELHDSHSDYPLAPESMTVENEMLSPFSKELKEKLQIKGQPASKLIPNLYDKTNYITHYTNLKFYLQQGMVLKKIHRIIQFKQSPWLKSYIDFNTEKRKYANSDFEKDFFKLMNNSVFGKTMENLRNRMNVEFVNDPKKMKKLCAKPSFQTFKIFNENLTAVHMAKTKLVLKKPIYIGFVVLDVSKILMYRFHYNYMKIRYEDRAKLLFTDTDSLCYEIQTDDIYQDMMHDKQHFDTSNYKKDSFLYSEENKKVLGKMKDECAGAIVEEFIGLRSKMYSLSYEGKEKKTAKGVKRRVIEFNIRHQDYKDSLLNNQIQHSDMNQIRSYNHKVYSEAWKKISLSPYDDKRYIMENGCDTLAHGHYRTK